MLAGETAVGAFPVRAVRTLDAVIRDAELLAPREKVVPVFDASVSRHGRALCEAAVTLATAGQADAIVAVTREGKTARWLAALRPSVPVFAATGSRDTASRVAVLWGVTPVLTPERQIEPLEHIFIQRQLIPAGSVVVFINVSPELNRSDTNFLNVQSIG
jgi:pyruvate kinase